MRLKNERVFIFIFLLLQIGCASKAVTKDGHVTNPAASASIGTILDEKSYAQLIAKNTRHDQRYDGFYNKFEVYATFLNSEVQAALLQKKTEALSWSAPRAQTEREKLFQENSNQTKFAISFFVPSVRLNDLHKKTSIWQLYLDVGGKRYEGKVSRLAGKFEDIQSLFNYHTRWSIAYDVVFDVPLSGVEGHGPVTFTLTSTQGAATLKF